MSEKKATLADVQHAVLRDLLGTYTANVAGLTIDANTNDCETDNAVDYFINGIGYTLAAQAAIDISGKGGDGVGVSVANGYTQLFVLQADSAGVLTFKAGDAVLTADITAGTKFVDVPAPDSGTCPIGGIKVVNSSGSAFVFGTTTTLNTYGTFYDFTRLPVGSDIS